MTLDERLVNRGQEKALFVHGRVPPLEEGPQVVDNGIQGVHEVEIAGQFHHAQVHGETVHHVGTVI